MDKLITTSANGISIGEPQSEQDQTDLDKRVRSGASRRLLYSWSAQ